MSVRIDGNLLLEILEETPATQNIMLMGKHGIGKSQILEKFYTEKGCKVVSLFLGQMSDPEYQGLILFTDGYAEVPKLLKNKQILWILTGKYQYESAIKWIKEFRFNKATWIPSPKANA